MVLAVAVVVLAVAVVVVGGGIGVDGIPLISGVPTNGSIVNMIESF